MGPLSEKVAIVTGGGSGIGEGLCRERARLPSEAEIPPPEVWP